MGLISDALGTHPDFLDIHKPTSGRRAVMDEGLQIAAGIKEDQSSGRYRDFEHYIQHRNPSLLDFEHGPLLAKVGEEIIRGVHPRTLIFAPPRYLKSEFFSRLLPGYDLHQYRQDSVALISYGDSLALELSEEARDHFVAGGGILKTGTEGKKRWASSSGGLVWATGVGGRFLGKGFRLGIIDDPVDPEQAISLAYQHRFVRFWERKFLSRQEPGARIVCVFQRLGPEDPADYLFRREVGDGVELAPEHWHVVCLDEIKSDEPLGRWNGPRGLPPTCTYDGRDDERRSVGEVLAPSRFDAEAVQRMHRVSGSYVVAAQRQQRPSNLEGDFWREEWFQTYEELPGGAYDGGKDWDTAYTKDEVNAASGYVESYRGIGDAESFPIYIEDVDWNWLEFPQLVHWMKTGKSDVDDPNPIPGWQGPHYVEEKATGKSLVQVLSAQSIAASEIPVHGDKFARSQAVQAVVSNKRVFVNQKVVRKLLKGERQGLLRITAVALSMSEGSLDVNDMFTQALWRHLNLGGKKRKRVAFR